MTLDTFELMFSPPATGTYVGPDGHVYTQANLARSATEEQTWQTMLLPPKAGSRASR